MIQELERKFSLVYCCSVFQIQCLQQEKARLAKELDEVHRMHKEEMELQQLQHYQVRKSHLHTGIGALIL